MADPFADYEEDPFAAYAEVDSVQAPMQVPTDADFWDKIFPHGRSTAERIQAQPGFGGKASEYAKGVYNMGGDIASYPGRWVAQTGAGVPMEDPNELPISGQGWGQNIHNFGINMMRSPVTALTAGTGTLAAKLGPLAQVGANVASGAIPAAGEWWANDAPASGIALQGLMSGGLGGLATGAGKLAGKGVRVAEDAFRGMARVLADKSREYGQAGADDLRRFVQPLLNESLSESGLRAAIKKRVEAFAEAGDAAANETSPAAASIRNQIRQSAGVPANKRVFPSDQEIAKAELMNQAGSRWDPNGPNLSDPLTVGDLVGRAKFNAEMNARSGILKGSADQVAKTLDNLGDASSVLRGHGKETPVSYADFPNLLRRVNYAAFHPGTGVAPANANEISREAGDLFREEIADMMYNNPALSREIQSRLIAAKKPYAQAMRVEAMLRKDPTSINADRSALGWAANKVGMPVAIPLIARRAAQLGQGGSGLASRYVPPAVADALFVQPQRPTR